MNKILFVEPNNPGDVLMATVAVRSLKKALPDTELHFLVDKECSNLLENNQNISKLHIFPRAGLKELFLSAEKGWNLGIKLLDEFLEELKRENFDWIINYFQNPIGPILVNLINPKKAAGPLLNTCGSMIINDKWTRYLFAVPFARQYCALHVSDIFCRIAGVKGDGNGPDLYLSRKELENAENFFKTEDLKPPVVAIQAGSAYSSKRWLPQYFTKLAKMLIKKGYKLLFLGAPQELEFINAIVKDMPEKPAFGVGKTTLRQSGALIKMSNYLISGDTAAVHMASAFNTKTISIYGPTSPCETGPYGNGHHVLSGHCNCFGRYTEDCINQKCMQEVTPEAVLGCLLNKCINSASSLRHSLSAWDKVNKRMVYPGWEPEEIEDTALALLRIWEGALKSVKFASEKQPLLKLKEHCKKGLEIQTKMIRVFQEKCDNKALARKYDIFEKGLDKISGCVPFLAADYRIKNNSLEIKDALALCAGIKRNLEELAEKAHLLLGED
ncbi:MAG: glycosyltransferase family 9 protein [bacterium]